MDKLLMANCEISNLNESEGKIVKTMLSEKQIQILKEQIKILADWNEQESKREIKNVEQIRLNCETIAKLTQVC